MQKQTTTGQKPMQKSASAKTSGTATQKSASAKSCCTPKSTNAKSGKDCCNSMTEFAQDMAKLTDAEIISDVLGSHKSLIKLYGTALCESSCEKMRKLIESEMQECACDQFDAFLFMNQRGLYPTDNADNSKMTKAKQKFNGACQDMRK